MNACFMFKSCNATQSAGDNFVTRDCGIPPLPFQCFNNEILTSSKRSVNTTYEYLYQYQLHKYYLRMYTYSNTFSTSYNTADDATTNDDWQGSQWYKIGPTSGAFIPEYPPGRYFCNALYPGWMNSTHPEEIGATKRVPICFQNETNTCMDLKEALVTNCNKYFVYFLDNVPSQNMKYCTADNNKREMVMENGCLNNLAEQDSLGLPTYFKCENQDKCFPEAYKCDGVQDCDDGSDEAESSIYDNCAPA